MWLCWSSEHFAYFVFYNLYIFFFMAQLMSAQLDFGSHLKDSNTDCLTSSATVTKTGTELELKYEIETLRLSCVCSIKTLRTSQFNYNDLDQRRARTQFSS